MRLVGGWRALSIMVCLLAGMAARADEDKVGKVPLDKVPKAVLKAVKAKFKGAKFVSASTEKDNGKLVYEIVIDDKGQNVDVSVAPDGKILSYERAIEIKDLPKPVTEAIKREYPKAKMRRAEELHENDKTSFEVLIVTADKKQIEVVVGRDGKIHKAQSEEGEEKKKEKKDK